MTDKREQILRAALELFASQGLAVPTARIAKEAGVANGTLFNYFPTKQDLVDTVYVSMKTELGGMFTAADLANSELSQAFRSLWHAYVRWALSHPHKHKVMHMLKASDAITPCVITELEAGYLPLLNIVRQGMDNGHLTTLEPAYFQAILTALIEVCIDSAVNRNLRGKALESHIQLGFELFWKAVT